MTLLELQEVTKEYPVRLRKGKKNVIAVNQVNLILHEGESLALVGESGSGKSTIARLITNIESITSGQILLDGKSIHRKDLKYYHLYKNIQLVLQDSATSLHPKMTVQEIITEPIRNFFPNEKNWNDICVQLLTLVGLDATFLTRYAHQLSGGQKQRVCMAKALAVQPKLIIFDESIASLDRLSQIAIIKMLKSIQVQEQITYLFITHDLQSAKHLCNRVAVMQEGKIVEIFSDWDEEKLKHPYTKLLFRHSQ
ncbi:dipeptide/oligopeptide/nickel ABC transporter ATP-binding protein [Lysinibacillus capsici]|uniref:ABC transporter ATP-binding protein n=1 Tax=Lysinibacillus capsici TaxID=2115968 RepID=UPI0029DE6CD7|nr:dipeptide/oligopeptide/nickel ABC transporter ATP-binding protein [Lysinibacillus capsici]WPK07497.1 dipeptide/oligopeptide/nickel ABC transporter ATP-binding protein [Lysinibacillus capsici]